MSFSGHVVYGGFYSPPFMYWSKPGVLQGPLVQLASEIANYFDLVPTFKDLSQLALNAFGDSGIDVGLGVFETPSRRVHGDFSHPIMQFGLQGLCLGNYCASSLEELKEKRLRFGVKEGDIGHVTLLRNFGSDWVDSFCLVVPAKSTQEPWSLLQQHECDLIVCDALTLAHWKAELTEPAFWAFPEPIDEVNMSFLVRRESPLSVRSINQWLAVHANQEIYANFVASVWSLNELAFRPCSIPSS